MKGGKTAFLPALMFTAGLLLLLYPTSADIWNRVVQRYTTAGYYGVEVMLTESDKALLLEEAHSYNERIRAIGFPKALTSPGEIPGYSNALNIAGNGVMGTITIGRIGVDLTIYHGTGAKELSKGAGHLQGSSLPVGGEGTHCVISAHTGLPGAKLFTDLDQLEVGDRFTLHILGDDLVYEIDRIVTVLPTEIEELFPSEGEDYCTLMTCTPYGINTHRLLLRGRRVNGAGT